jgi:excisionase family DNA binding protein
MALELLRKRDVMKLCRVSARTVDNWVRRRRINFVKFGKVVRFIPEDVNKFIEAHKIFEARSHKLGGQIPRLCRRRKRCRADNI